MWSETLRTDWEDGGRSLVCDKCFSSTCFYLSITHTHTHTHTYTLAAEESLGRDLASFGCRRRQHLRSPRSQSLYFLRSSPFLCCTNTRGETAGAEPVSRQILETCCATYPTGLTHRVLRETLRSVRVLNSPSPPLITTINTSTDTD